MAAVRVKICGITTPEDAHHAVQAGADAIGLNFFEQSPRFVTIDQAAAIRRHLPPLIDTVGVFVGTRIRQACAIAYQLGLGGIQLLAERTDLEDSFPFRRIAAFRIKDTQSVKEIEEYLAIAPRPAAILVDAFVAGQWGGTGQVAPWEVLRDFRPGVPIILAGGLTPDNVTEAIRIVRPDAVDVASGVESAPGRKDPERMRRFVEAAKLAL
jgi:phosphoribosylanthranilate isomerase